MSNTEASFAEHLNPNVGFAGSRGGPTFRGPGGASRRITRFLGGNLTFLRILFHKLAGGTLSSRGRAVTPPESSPENPTIMNAFQSRKSFTLVASLFVALMTGCAAGTDTDGEQEGTQEIAQASAAASADDGAAVARKDPRSLNDRGVRKDPRSLNDRGLRKDPRSLNDRGPGLDPRSEANIEVPAYKGAETAPVIEAVMAPTQPGSKGTVHMGSEAACSLENGKWIPEFDLCLTAAEFAAPQAAERF
jgi:hypothetical protein